MTTWPSVRSQRTAPRSRLKSESSAPLRSHRHHDVGTVDVDNAQIHPVTLPQCGAANDVTGDAVEHDAAPIEQDESVRELASQGQVVQGREHREAALGAFLLQEFQELHLVAQVQT